MDNKLSKIIENIKANSNDTLNYIRSKAKGAMVIATAGATMLTATACNSNKNVENNEDKNSIGIIECDHTWEEKESHTEDECISYKQCTKCDETMAEAEFVWSGIAREDIPATCTEEGVKYTNCNCGEKILSSETVPALGHVYSDWYEFKAPTCDKDGEERRHCINDFGPGSTIMEQQECNAFESRTIPAYEREHDWVKVDEHEGYAHVSYDKCANCGTEGDTKTYSIEAFNTGWYIEPTCNEGGEHVINCGECGETLLDKYIPATGEHTECFTIIKKPTERTEGIAIEYCDECMQVTNIHVLEALGNDLER